LGQKSSGGSDSKTTSEVSGTNSLFIGTVSESEVTFSQKHIIGEIEVIFLIKSIELFDKMSLVFFFDDDSFEPISSSFGVKGEGDISSVEPIFISLIDHFERFNEKLMEISPFGETDFIISISIGGSEKKSDFSRGHMMSSIDIVEFF
jgi:hypothetical protein